MTVQKLKYSDAGRKIYNEFDEKPPEKNLLKNV